jgi:hypothetical protein
MSAPGRPKRESATKRAAMSGQHTSAPGRAKRESAPKREARREVR